MSPPQTGAAGRYDVTWSTWPEALALLARGKTAAIATPIAVAVGTILTVVNQGGDLLSGQISTSTAVRIAFNCLVPFCVASAGILGPLRVPIGRRPPVEDRLAGPSDAATGQPGPDGAVEQAIGEARDRLEAMTGRATDNLERARSARAESAEANQLVASSRNDVAAMKAAVATMVEAADRINGVLEQIDEVAATTHMLALNATIEAARAGEAGRSFAVVADEVKNLADESARSVTESRAAVGEVLGYLDDVRATGTVIDERFEATIDRLLTIDGYTSAIYDAAGAQPGTVVEIIQLLEVARTRPDSVPVSR